MRHKCPVITVKKLLKSVYIYGSYRKNKTGVPFFGTPCSLIKAIQSLLIAFAIKFSNFYSSTGYSKNVITTAYLVLEFYSVTLYGL